MTDFFTRRGATWHFVRRVPAAFAAFDRRGVVRHSTRIKIADDRVGRRAARVADTPNRELERYWKSLAAAPATASVADYDDARKRVRALGFEYAPNDQLLSAPLEKRLR